MVERPKPSAVPHHVLGWQLISLVVVVVVVVVVVDDHDGDSEKMLIPPK